MQKGTCSHLCSPSPPPLLLVKLKDQPSGFLEVNEEVWESVFVSKANRDISPPPFLFLGISGGNSLQRQLLIHQLQQNALRLDTSSSPYSLLTPSTSQTSIPSLWQGISGYYMTFSTPKTALMLELHNEEGEQERLVEIFNQLCTIRLRIVDGPFSHQTHQNSVSKFVRQELCIPSTSFSVSDGNNVVELPSIVSELLFGFLDQPETTLLETGWWVSSVNHVFSFAINSLNQPNYDAEFKEKLANRCLLSEAIRQLFGEELQLITHAPSWPETSKLQLKTEEWTKLLAAFLTNVQDPAVFVTVSGEVGRLKIASRLMQGLCNDKLQFHSHSTAGIWVSVGRLNPKSMGLSREGITFDKDLVLLNVCENDPDDPRFFLTASLLSSYHIHVGELTCKQQAIIDSRLSDERFPTLFEKVDPWDVELLYPLSRIIDFLVQHTQLKRKTATDAEEVIPSKMPRFAQTLKPGRENETSTALMMGVLNYVNFPPPYPLSSVELIQSAILNKELLDNFKTGAPFPKKKTLLTNAERKAGFIYDPKVWKHRVQTRSSLCRTLRWKMLEFIVAFYIRTNPDDDIANTKYIDIQHVYDGLIRPLHSTGILYYNALEVFDPWTNCQIVFDIGNGDQAKLLITTMNRTLLQEVDLCSIYKIEGVNEYRSVNWLSDVTFSSLEVEVCYVEDETKFQIVFRDPNSSGAPYKVTKTYEQFQELFHHLKPILDANTSGITVNLPSSGLMSLLWNKKKKVEQLDFCDSLIKKLSKEIADDLPDEHKERFIDFLRPQTVQGENIIILSTMSTSTVLKVNDEKAYIAWLNALQELRKQVIRLHPVDWDTFAKQMVEECKPHFNEGEIYPVIQQLASNMSSHDARYAGIEEAVTLAEILLLSLEDINNMKKKRFIGVPVGGPGLGTIKKHLDCICGFVLELTSPPKPGVVMVIGRTGAGKSTLINGIMRKVVFQQGVSLRSMTGAAQEVNYQDLFTLVDTRGWGEVKEGIQQDLAGSSEQSVANAIKKYKPDVLLYVAHPIQLRSSNTDEKQIAAALQQTHKLTGRSPVLVPVLTNKRENLDVRNPTPASLKAATIKREKDFRGRLIDAGFKQQLPLFSVSSIAEDIKDGNPIYKREDLEDLDKLVAEIQKSLPEKTYKRVQDRRKEIEEQQKAKRALGRRIIGTFAALNTILSTAPGVDFLTILYTEMMCQLLAVTACSSDRNYNGLLKQKTYNALIASVNILRGAGMGTAAFLNLTGVGMLIGLPVGALVGLSSTVIIGSAAMGYYQSMSLNTLYNTMKALSPNSFEEINLPTGRVPQMKYFKEAKELQRNDREQMLHHWERLKERISILGLTVEKNAQFNNSKNALYELLAAELKMRETAGKMKSKEPTETRKEGEAEEGEGEGEEEEVDEERRREKAKEEEKKRMELEREANSIRQGVWSWLNENTVYQHKHAKFELSEFVNEDWQGYLKDVKTGKSNGDLLTLLAFAEKYHYRFTLISSIQSSKYLIDIIPTHRTPNTLPSIVLGCFGFKDTTNFCRPIPRSSFSVK